jgi:hypothetical protein
MNCPQNSGKPELDRYLEGATQNIPLCTTVLRTALGFTLSSIERVPGLFPAEGNAPIVKTATLLVKS